MKRYLIYVLAALFTLSFVGCAYDEEIDDPEVPEAAPNNGYTGYNGTTGNGNGMYNNDYNNDLTRNTGMNGDYVTSLRGINNTLRTSLDDMVEIDDNDPDYYTKQGEYYNNRAKAYRKAYDDIGGLDYGDDYRQHHNTIRDYYWNGYNTFNNLGTRYSSFITADDERLYRDEVGDAGFDIGDDIRTGYYDAMDAIGINVDRRY